MATSRQGVTGSGAKVRLAVTATGKAPKVVRGSGSSRGLVSPQGRPQVAPSRRIAQ